MRAFARCALVASAWVIAQSAQAAPLSPLTKGPWLSQLGAKEVVIRVETDPPQPLTLKWSGAADAGVHERRESSELLHSIRIDGLEPKTRYEYTVEVSGVKVTGHFTTAPADEDDGDFRFILYGDNRSDPTRHAAVVHAVDQEAGEFLINTGDLVDDGGSSADWQSFFDVEGATLRDRCLFAAIGNHELVETSGAAFVRYFGGARTMVPGKLYGTMRWGKTRFFFLNGMGDFTADDRSWLEIALGSADTEDLRWRIVVIHDGPYASGVHGDNKSLHAAKIPAMLLRHKVNLVLSGHDHLYERGNGDGLRYVVSGGGGAPLYPVKNLRATTHKAESTNHVVAFDVGKEVIKLTAKRTDGSTLESVSLTNAGWSDDPTPASAPVFPSPSDPTPKAKADHCDCRVGPGAANGSDGAHWAGALAVLIAPLFLRRRTRAQVANVDRKKLR